MTHSVIIPAYRADKYIAETIASIKKQTVKANEIIVGVDCCPKTWRELCKIRRAEKRLNIRLYWFPQQAGPYVIRNTLATLANSDIIHFFDADDVMKPNHIAVMSQIKPGQFMTCNAEYDIDKETKPLAHGVMTIHKADFINNNGYEDWPCGADTEAIYRWQWQGLERRTSNQLTATIRQHDEQLTKRQDANSPQRTKAIETIRQRAISPKRIQGIKTAHYSDTMTQPHVDTMPKPATSKPYRIVMVSDHCCIRVVKQSIALQAAGHTVVNVCRRIANQDMAACLGFVKMYETMEDLARCLTGLQDYDIFHVHNEPSQLGSFVKETLFNKPVVFDAHDLNAVRYGKPDQAEYKSLTMCDASVFVSVACMDIAKRMYHMTRPCEVIYSACNMGLADIPREAHRPGIVYEGAISDGSDIGYLDYRPVANKLAKLGIPFHIYAASNRFNHLYPTAVVHPTHRYEALISELSRYDWGFVGPGKAHAQWRHTIPNKLFEYVAAGIPVICWQADECATLVNQHGIGVVVSELSQIKEAYSHIATCRANVMRLRKSMTMEAQVTAIESLYGKLLQQ